ncbi:MAG TPA: trehalose-phosphatase [Bacteroidota bacterium]|nr:trehalose-phosphatase [Bacteroidota bacterium]
MPENIESHLIASENLERLRESYRKCKSRLLLLDYDGTLVDFALKPELAIPGPEIVRLLRVLANEPSNSVFLISGREKASLEKWFGDFPLGLIAEHGAWIREKHGGWMLLKQQSNDWKPRIIPILQDFARRLPGAFVQEKDFSVVWHYRGSAGSHGEEMARELIDHLETVNTDVDVQVLQGKKIVEVRNTGVNKGVAGVHLLNQHQYDFVLAIGDDSTDEDLFAVLPPSAFSVRVGVASGNARFNVLNVAEVRAVLEAISGFGE